MSRSLPFVLLVLMVIGCKPKVPLEIIQPDKLEDILYDYHVSQAMAKASFSSESDYERNKLFYAVLKKHGVSEAEFDSSLVYYYIRLERLYPIYRRVSDRLAAEAKGLGVAAGELNRYSQYGENGDTANIWTQDSEALLIPRPTMNRFDFVVKADSTFRLGDSFMFQFMTQYIWQSGMKDAVVCVKTAYEGDSVIQTTSHISAPGIAQMHIPLNRTLKVKEMRGFIYLTNNQEDADMRRMLFISQIQFIRFHHKEIEDAHETARRDSLAPDSLQRAADTRRPTADTTGALPVGQGLRSKSAPFRRGGAPNTVDARKNSAKAKP